MAGGQQEQQQQDGGDAPPLRFSGGRSSRADAAAAPQQQQQLVPHPAPQQQQPPPPRPSTTAAAAAARARQVPDSITGNVALAAAMQALPANYNFEVHKTVWRIQQAGATKVALQFPEGLLMYAATLADIFTEHAGVEHCFIMGDVTYGACCIDDLSAGALGAQLLVHYGHSCLVPLDATSIPCLYVFVDIAIDVDHLVASLAANWPGAAGAGAAGGASATPAIAAAAAADKQDGNDQQQQQQQQQPEQQQQPARIVLAGTIQFGSAIQLARQRLAASHPGVTIPKARPLSPGEVLGCTAPALPPGSADALVFVADGRFHLEAMMVSNPWLPAYRYDPYARALTRERYDQAGMRAARRAAVAAAANARRWGLVLGTLGRQGSPRTAAVLQEALEARGASVTVVLLSEVSPTKLAAFGGCFDAWVQVACPRLSIDWGEGFAAAGVCGPVLTPYEAMVALGRVPGWWEQPQQQQQQCACACQASAGTAGGGSCSSCSCGAAGSGAQAAAAAAAADYPMDYYARDGGVWNSSWHKPRPPAAARAS